MKKDRSSRIILPDRDGIASLDIRRVKKELAGKSGNYEMHGHMPATVIPEIVKQLEAIISDVQKGEVSTICVFTIMPKANGMDSGKALMSGPHDEMDKLHELFHLTLNERLEGMSPDDEAG